MYSYAQKRLILEPLFCRFFLLVYKVKDDIHSQISSGIQINPTVRQNILSVIIHWISDLRYAYLRIKHIIVAKVGEKISLPANLIVTSVRIVCIVSYHHEIKKYFLLYYLFVQMLFL